MLDKYFRSPFTLEQLRNGPSGSLLGGFAGSLYEDGYSWLTARSYLRAAHHLGHFLRSEGLWLCSPTRSMCFDIIWTTAVAPNPGAERRKTLFAGPSVFSGTSGLLASLPSL